jgi:hypothetical protein
VQVFRGADDRQAFVAASLRLRLRGGLSRAKSFGSSLLHRQDRMTNLGSHSPFIFSETFTNMTYPRSVFLTR